MDRELFLLAVGGSIWLAVLSWCVLQLLIAMGAGTGIVVWGALVILGAALVGYWWWHGKRDWIWVDKEENGIRWKERVPPPDKEDDDD